MNLNKYDYNKKVNQLFIVIDSIMIILGLLSIIYLITKNQWVGGIVAVVW